MYRTAIGKINHFTADITEQNVVDTMVVCRACNRIIPSRTNLTAGHICPFCHRDVNESLTNDILDDDSLSFDDDDDIIAIAC